MDYIYPSLYKRITASVRYNVKNINSKGSSKKELIASYSRTTLLFDHLQMYLQINPWIKLEEKSAFICCLTQCRTHTM